MSEHSSQNSESEKRRARAIKIVRGKLPLVGSENTTMSWATEIVDAIIDDFLRLRGCRARQPDPSVGRLCGLIENHDGPHSWEEAHGSNF